VGHFSNAFRRTLGVAPHQWLTEQRIALSKEKLRDDGLSLSDVATECGFSDQSRLTRLFTPGDVAVEPLCLELISCPATTFVVVNRFDCATAHPSKRG
jgi:Helix-turn-helix domain